jgi:HTH-type transcriptional regulator / antitoxin HipB
MAYTGKVTSAESLGRILQQARLLSGLSQRELARRLGTTQKYVWELEAGKPSIMMDRLFAAMRETGMELTATIAVLNEQVKTLPGRLDLPVSARHGRDPRRRCSASLATTQTATPTARAAATGRGVRSHRKL